MTTGKRIQKARKEKGLTQKELGDKLGVSASMVAQYENDLRNPKIETAEKIAHVLDVTSDFLLGRVDDPHTRWATQDNYDKFDAPSHMWKEAEMMDKKYLAEIRTRAQEAKAEKQKGNDLDCACLSWAIVLNDIPALLAEVERLTEENDVLKSECKAHIRQAQEQEAHHAE